MNENAIIQFKKTDNILSDVQTIIEFARQNAYQAVNISMLQRNWLLGYRIAEEELSGKERAEYGLEIIKKAFDRADRNLWERLYQIHIIQLLFVL